MGVDLVAVRPYLLYLALLLVTVSLPTVRARAGAGVGLLLSGLGMAAGRVGGDPGGGFATVNGMLIAVGLAIVVLAAIGGWRRQDATPPRHQSSPARMRPSLPLVAGLLFVLFGPHLILVTAGAFLVLVSGAATVLRARRPAWLTLVLVAALLLGAGFFLVFTILGPAGGRMSELVGGPFSPPAERLLAILLGAGSLGLAGIFPFHRAPWRLTLAPLAAILTARILVPAFPEGFADWQSPAMLWLAVGVAAEALLGRWAAVMVGAGLMGIWSGRPGGIEWGGLLGLFGWLTSVGLLPPSARNGGRWSGLWLLIPAAGIPLLLEATLRVQVLLSVAVIAALAIGLGVESRRPARVG